MNVASFKRILSALDIALAGRKLENVSIHDLLPAIFDAAPNASMKEITAALRWSVEKRYSKAEVLRRFPRYTRPKAVN